MAHIQREFAIDSVQFYDNNFFLREDDVADLARRITPLNLSWWCEGRIDILLRYSDATMHALRRSGCKMIFLGRGVGVGQDPARDGQAAHQRTDVSNWPRASASSASSPSSPS